MIKRRYNELAAALSLVAMLAALPTAAVAADYKLGVSDRVKIKIQEWPDLTGEYTITPDGAVSLPMIGDIDAVGLRLNELGQQISNHLKQRSGGTDQVLTAVEVVQYRPFAIMGDVQKPGQYPFRPGLTVLEAISMASGYYRPELGLVRLGRDVAIASGEINTQNIKLNRLLVHEARLSAALSGREDFPLPSELSKLKDNPEILAVVESEQAALALTNKMKQHEHAAFESIKSLYQNEISSLQGQVQALSEEKESIGTQLNQLRSMATRGLALSPTLFALERSFAQVSNEQMSTQTAIVRANESITQSEQRITELQQERGRLDSKDLQQTRDLIAETRAKIETATLLFHEAQTSAPAEARALLSQDGDRPRFAILRKDGETIRQIVADETTLVAPDDVIKVPSIRTPLNISSSFNNLTRAELPER